MNPGKGPSRDRGFMDRRRCRIHPGGMWSCVAVLVELELVVFMMDGNGSEGYEWDRSAVSLHDSVTHISNRSDSFTLALRPL